MARVVARSEVGLTHRFEVRAKRGAAYETDHDIWSHGEGLFLELRHEGHEDFKEAEKAMAEVKVRLLK